MSSRSGSPDPAVVHGSQQARGPRTNAWFFLHMDRARLQRRTLVPTAALPSTQVYSDDEGQLWHDLRHVHVKLCDAGYSQPWKSFSKDLRSLWSDTVVAPHQFFLGQAVGTHVSNICSTLALYIALWGLVARSRVKVLASASAAYIKQACILVDQAPWDGQGEQRELAGRPAAAPLTIHRDHRKVAGMRALILTRHHQTRETWKRTWSTMYADGILHESWDQDEHDLSDIVLFALHYTKQRRKCPSHSVSSLRDVYRLGDQVLGYVARVVDCHLEDAMGPQSKQDDCAPSWVSPKKVAKPHSDDDADVDTPTRKYVVVQPEAVWSIIQEARREGCSMEQVVGIRSKDEHMGCAKSNCPAWRGRLGDMYRARRMLALDGTSHLCICADPSTHCRRETMATLVWSWEMGIAAHGDLQIMGSAHSLLLEESLPDQIGMLAAELRLERTAAYRQLQSWSNCIQGLGHWPRGLNEFCLPEGVNVHAVEPGEVRVVVQGAAMRVNRITGDCCPLLPPGTLASTQGFPCLVLCLDQGSIGAAAAAFADSDSMRAMVHCKWDKFHRIVRDIRLSVTHCCKGIFLKTQVFTTYLWSVNQKPFGTGCFQTQKHNMLNVFLAVNGIDSPVFCKYLHRIAHDLGLPCETQAEKQAVFDAVLPNAKSFQQACDLPKMGRWFSWNACAYQQLREYWIMKAVLEDQYDDLMDPDEQVVSFSDVLGAARARTPQAELAQLKATGGGLKLALRLMTTELWVHAKILYIVTRACWTWYVTQVKTITTPRHGLQQTLASSQGRWRSDDHLANTVRDSMLKTESLEYMGIMAGDSVLAECVVSLAWTVVSHRAWSLAVRHQAPPECYAELLSPNQERQQAAVDLVRRNWQAVILLEQRRHEHAPAKRLWSDIQFLKNTPIRLLHVLFESAQYSTDCLLGKHLPFA